VHRRLLYAAPLAVAAFWATLALSIAANPGFNPLREQFSVLGTEEASCPALYNGGLAATGMLIALYGLALLGEEGWRRPGALMALAAASLVAASLLPGRSLIHVYATRAFFLFLSVSFTLLGVEWVRRHAWEGAVMLLVALVAPPVWLAVKLADAWPGALGEVYGVAVACFLLLYDWRLRSRVGGGSLSLRKG